MRVGNLFNGIGGFALAAHWMGWQNSMHCEIDPFCNKVMKHHFPESIQHEDIRNTDFTIHRGQLDLITGGFPCQPYSTAGKRKGKDDERHLWPEMRRAIREIQPGWVVGENVRGLISWNGGLVFDEVQADLEAEGYEVLPFLLPAASVSAPHRRDRIWFIAHAIGARAGGNYGAAGNQRGPTGDGGPEGLRQVYRPAGSGWAEATGTNDATNAAVLRRDRDLSAGQGIQRTEPACGETGSGDSENGADTNALGDKRSQGRLYEVKSGTTGRHVGQCGTRDNRPTWQDFPTQPPVCSGDDGLSDRLAPFTVSGKYGSRTLNKIQSYGRWRKESVKALGNAIVPQVAYQIFKAIEQYETMNQ